VSDSDRKLATGLLIACANALGEAGARFTPEIALELAAMLCHVAGGDGRGVYRIEHDPTGDLPPALRAAADAGARAFDGLRDE
jgi:hypothetical protein